MFVVSVYTRNLPNRSSRNRECKRPVDDNTIATQAIQGIPDPQYIAFYTLYTINVTI